MLCFFGEPSGEKLVVGELCDNNFSPQEGVACMARVCTACAQTERTVAFHSQPRLISRRSVGCSRRGSTPFRHNEQPERPESFLDNCAQMSPVCTSKARPLGT